MADTYILARTASESERIDLQHKLHVTAAGYHLHPVVAKSLPADARIAEIATGTSVFLQELATQLPPTCTFDGFDISPAMFPPESKRAPNVKLHLHNAKEPFPSDMLGRFDVVHIRLLICALHSHDEWTSVARNALALLKPGGRIQWCEAAFTDMLSVPGGLRREGVPASEYQPKTGRHVLDLIGGNFELFNRGWNTLAGILRELGCEGVLVDSFSTDRDTSDLDLGRFAASSLEILPFQSIYTSMCASGKISDSEQEQAERLADIEKDILADQAHGYYLRYSIHVTIGRKAP